MLFISIPKCMSYLKKKREEIKTIGFRIRLHLIHTCNIAYYNGFRVKNE